MRPRADSTGGQGIITRFIIIVIIILFYFIFGIYNTNETAFRARARQSKIISLFFFFYQAFFQHSDILELIIIMRAHLRFHW
jgi:hypothetical protein